MEGASTQHSYTQQLHSIKCSHLLSEISASCDMALTMLFSDLNIFYYHLAECHKYLTTSLHNYLIFASPIVKLSIKDADVIRNQIQIQTHRCLFWPQLPDSSLAMGYHPPHNQPLPSWTRPSRPQSPQTPLQHHLSFTSTSPPILVTCLYTSRAGVTKYTSCTVVLGYSFEWLCTLNIRSSVLFYFKTISLSLLCPTCRESLLTNLCTRYGILLGYSE
jgi:hypothetical protein